MTFHILHLLTITLQQDFAKIPTTVHSYCCSNVVKHSEMFKILIYSNFNVCQPVIWLGCTGCMIPDFLYNKNSNHVGLTKLLFQWTFIHCTVVFPFIFHYSAFIFKLLIERWETCKLMLKSLMVSYSQPLA